MDPTTYQQALAGTIPRPEYLILKEALGADLYDFTDVAASTRRSVIAARRYGPRFGLAALGCSMRKRYDHFYCTGEDIALPFGMMMACLADFGRITAVVHNVGTPKRRALLRAIPSRVWRHVICIGDEQERLLTEDSRVPAERVHRLPYWVDTKFFDPDRADRADRSDRSDDRPFVFACGQEGRDYETLGRAAAGSDLRFVVVASGWSPDMGYSVTDTAQVAANVQVERGSLTFLELRARYAAARVVAVPLKEMSYSAGVTSILEAMSMAKPLVVSRSTGIVDYVDDGVSGCLAPVGDADAFSRAIEHFYLDVDHAAEVGERNRVRVKELHTVEQHGARVAELLAVPLRSGPLQRSDSVGSA